MKEAVPRELANWDIEEGIKHYLVKAPTKVALRFVDGREKAYDRIARHPSSGSPRYAHQMNDV
jgi:toxin ParE1/3/4